MPRKRWLLNVIVLCAIPMSAAGRTDDLCQVEQLVSRYYAGATSAATEIETLFPPLVGDLGYVRSVETQAGDLLLDVPYRGQWDADSGSCRSLNCGPACVAMLLGSRGSRREIADIRDVLPKCDYTGITDLFKCAHHYRPDVVFERKRLADADAGREWLIEQIQDRRPVVLLIQAKHLPGRGYTFGGGHFVVVRGLSADRRLVAIRDPNNKLQNPRAIYPIEDLLRAWWFSAGGNNTLLLTSEPRPLGAGGP